MSTRQSIKPNMIKCGAAETSISLSSPAYFLQVRLLVEMLRLEKWNGLPLQVRRPSLAAAVHRWQRTLVHTCGSA